MSVDVTYTRYWELIRLQTIPYQIVLEGTTPILHHRKHRGDWRNVYGYSLRIWTYTLSRIVF